MIIIESVSTSSESFVIESVRGREEGNHEGYKGKSPEKGQRKVHMPRTYHVNSEREWCYDNSAVVLTKNIVFPEKGA